MLHTWVVLIFLEPIMVVMHLAQVILGRKFPTGMVCQECNLLMLINIAQRFQAWTQIKFYLEMMEEYFLAIIKEQI